MNPNSIKNNIWAKRYISRYSIMIMLKIDKRQYCENFLLVSILFTNLLIFLFLSSDINFFRNDDKLQCNC